jgi:hypothetical protein
MHARRYSLTIGLLLFLESYVLCSTQNSRSLGGMGLRSWYRQLFLPSAAACERATLGMTREEVLDGNERAAAFVVRKVRRQLGPCCTVTVE